LIPLQSVSLSDVRLPGWHMAHGTWHQQGANNHEERNGQVRQDHQGGGDTAGVAGERRIEAKTLRADLPPAAGQEIRCSRSRAYNSVNVIAWYRPTSRSSRGYPRPRHLATPARIGAVPDLWPVLRPGLAPAHRLAAMGAGFRGQRGLVAPEATANRAHRRKPRSSITFKDSPSPETPHPLT